MNPRLRKTLLFNTKKFKNQYSFLFDGINEYIERNNAIINGTPATFSAWIKLSSLNLVQRITTINQKSTTTNVLSIFIDANNKANAQHFDVDGVAALSTTVLTTNTWYHIVGVFTSDSSRTIYVNGVSENTNTTVQSAMTGLDYTSFGYISWTTNIQFFNGNIDEVGFFNTNLTAAQITEIYNNGKPKDLKKHSMVNNLVSYFRMGDKSTWDGTNWTLVDQKGTNNGTSVNMEYNDRSLDVKL